MTKDIKILPCSCKHEFQDKTYGVGKRLMNHAPQKGGKPNRYRCTVCQKEHDSKSGE